MWHISELRFSVGELHAASKTSSANGSHLNVWDFDISAAEFPQQKKARVLGVNWPLGAIQTKDARFFLLRQFKWGPLADEVLNTA